MKELITEWLLSRGFDFKNIDFLIDVIRFEPDNVYFVFLKKDNKKEAKEIANDLISFYKSIIRDNKLNYLLEYKLF